MQSFGTKLLLFILILGCGRYAPSTPRESCRLSSTGEQAVKTWLAEAEQQAKQKQFEVSDSIAMLALAVLDTCEERIWHYRCHYRLIMNAWYGDRPDDAIRQCRSWTDQASGVQDSVSGYYHSVLGWLYFVQEDFESARPQLEKAADLLEAAGRKEKLPGVYNNLAPCLIRLGDYESAGHYLQAAIRLNTERQDSFRLSLNYHNLGRNYNAAGQSDKAITCFQTSAALKGENDADYYEGMTKAWFNLRDYPAARTYAQQTLQAVEGEGGDPSAVAGALQWLGQTAAATGLYPQAIDYYRKALDIWVGAGDTTHYDYGKTCIFMGDAWLAAGQPQKALERYQHALGGFVPGLSKTDIRSNPSVAQLPNEIWVMEALRGKALAWERCFDQTDTRRGILTTGKSTRDTLLLKHALESAETAAMAMLHMKSLYEEDLSKLNLDNYGSLRFFEKTIQLACRLAVETGSDTYYHKAFCYSQRSKAGILRNALMERHAWYAAKLPADSIRKMDQLQMKIAVLDKQLVATEPGTILDSIEHGRFLLKREWSKILRWANSSLPRKPEQPDVDIPAIQQRLPEGALLVEYFAGQDFLYTFAVSKTGFTAWATPEPDHFETTCARFHRSASDLNWMLDSMALAEKTYLAQAHTLYEYLLSKAMTRFPDTRRLVIVPDGALGRIPFSALLTQAHGGSWRDTNLPLLLRQCAVSYLYSSALLPANDAIRQPKYGFGGFGADYRDPWTLPELYQTASQGNATPPVPLGARGGPGILDHADDEVDAIAHLVGGGKWLNGEATKSNFLREAGNYGILHFALHTMPASPRDLSGFCLVFSKTGQFEDNFLSANELASLDLHAELAVVSACYSGLGSFQQGEGTMSLGRAFALSGCPATIVNLWEANDEVSKQLMIRFYEHLKAGKPKDVALQEAQMEYLLQTPSAEAIPFYWANFVVTGDIAPVMIPEPRSWWDWLVFWE